MSRRPSRRTLFAWSSALALLFTLLPYVQQPAQANHPDGVCLDLEHDGVGNGSETDTNSTIPPANEHEIFATMRQDPDLLSPCDETDTAVDVDAGNGAVKISFEIDGPTDPKDDGDTPDTPDTSCSILEGNASCSITLEGVATGTDTIRGWIDHDGQSPPGGTTEADTAEGQDSSATGQPGDEAEPDDTDVVTKTWDTDFDCIPEEETNTVGDAHTVTCTATDTDGVSGIQGVNVDVEATGANDPDSADNPTDPDFTCTTDTNGDCTFTHHTTGSTTLGTTTYRAWVDRDNDNGTTEADSAEGRDETATPGNTAEPDETDVVETTWTAELDCTPETATNLLNQEHTVTCTATNSGGTGVEGAQIDAEATGANDPDDPDGDTPASPDFTCTTGSGGSCSFVHGDDEDTSEEGTTTYRSWVDVDGDDATTEADADEPRDETGEADEPDNTDVMEKTWEIGTPNSLDCDDSGSGSDTERETNPDQSGSDSNEVYTCLVTDSEGNPKTNEDVTVKGEVENGINDPDDPDAASYDSPDYTCQTMDSGDCTITVTQAEAEADTAEICFWVGTGTEGANLCAAEDTGENQDPNPGGGDTGNDLADQVEKTWEAREATTIDAEPEDDTNRLGESHDVTVTVFDQFGDPFAGGTTVSFEFFDGSPTDGDGNTPGTVDDFCTTPSGSASCTLTYSQMTTVGRDLLCAWIGSDPTMAGTNADGTCDGEGRDESGTPGATAEPDGVDVVEKNWISSATVLDCEPETAANPAESAHTVTCTATDGNGNVVQGALVDVEVTGANDPDEPDSDSPTSPDLTCDAPTDASGECTFTHGTTPAAGDTTYRAWIDADDDDGSVEADTAEGRDESLTGTPGDTSEPDDTDVVAKTWGASRLDCSPETSTNPAGSDHTVTCTATDGNDDPVEGALIDAEATGDNDPDSGDSPTSPDFGCGPTDTDGQCSFTHAGGDAPAAGDTTYRAWIDSDDDNATTEADADEPRDETGEADEPDNTDVVAKTWGASRLNCSPESDTNPADGVHTVSCTVLDEDSAPVEGADVDAEAAGANDPDGGDTPTTPDFTCTTGSGGTCSFVHGDDESSASAGTTSYRAWIDLGDGVEADAGEGADESGAPGDTDEPDNTDVVTKTWEASTLNCIPETDENAGGSDHEVTCSASDGNDELVEGTNVDVEATGENDPDDGNSPTSPDFTCTTAQDGTCSFTHGPSGTGSTDQLGTTTYRAWIDLDGNDASVEADTAEGRDESTQPGNTAEDDDTDVVSKDWIGPGLECSPETGENFVGQDHTVTCTFRDGNNEPVEGENVDVEATGDNDPDSADSPTSPDFSCTTDVDGECSFTHGPGGDGTATDTQGTTTYRAWIDSDGLDLSTEADSAEGRDESAEPGDTAEPDETDVVAKDWNPVPDTITIEPEVDSESVGNCNPFTITATNPDGAVPGVQIDVEQVHELAENATANDEPTVSFCVPDSGPNPSDVDTASGDLEESPDNPGTAGGETLQDTDADGKVTIGIAVQPGNGSDGTGEVDVTVWFEGDAEDDDDPNDPQDAATKAWTSPVAENVDCEPETSTNDTGTDHDVTCTVTDGNGDPIAGVDVNVEVVSGPNSGTTGTCTTGNDGSCTFTYTGDGGEGTDTVRGWVNTGDDRDTSEDADPNEPQDEVEKTWELNPCENPTITGTAGDDTITGTAGDDVIDALGGNDFVDGLEGDDLICLGPGDDTGRGRQGADTIFGEDGADTILSDNDFDEVHGGPGDDEINGGAQGDVINGGPGNDFIAGSPGEDDVSGGDGDDSINLARGIDKANGGPGVDFIHGSIGDDTVSGGGGGDNTIAGDSGDDSVSGGPGNDSSLHGGGGNDSVAGNDGDDRLFGEPGDDFLHGGPGFDFGQGGDGFDTCRSVEDPVDCEA